MSPPTIFRSEITAAGSEATLSLHGELDLSTEPQFSAAAALVLAGEVQAIVVDLRGLQFIDSTGIRALVGLKAVCEKREIRLSIIRGADAVSRLFAMCGLTGFFETVAEPAAALAA